MNMSPTQAASYDDCVSPRDTDTRSDFSGRVPDCTPALSISIDGTFADPFVVPRSPACNTTPATATPRHRLPPNIIIPHGIEPDRFWTPTHGHGAFALAGSRDIHSSPPTPTRPARSSTRVLRQSRFSSGDETPDHAASDPSTPFEPGVDARREAITAAFKFTDVLEDTDPSGDEYDEPFRDPETDQSVSVDGEFEESSATRNA
ncbi:hypothetical protein BV20DRAFT_1055421 [Pilatotrama ljubarskyi]|nr:hypothetical protein BV20DRAFT_1055421 [Pilatotrama ljubarskyi]